MCQTATEPNDHYFLKEETIDNFLKDFDLELYNPRLSTSGCLSSDSRANPS